MQNMVSVNRSQRVFDAFDIAVGDNSLSGTVSEAFWTVFSWYVS